MPQQSIFDITTAPQFEEAALETFRFQFENNSTYRSFCDLLYKHPSEIKRSRDIPFLPIQFFKSHTILTSGSETSVVFSSSGTTGSITSKHHVADLSLYEDSFRHAFAKAYGNPKDYVILALLPSYLERSGSSLIYMVDDLIKTSEHPDSGFYLNNLNELANKLDSLDKAGQKVLLIGVSFALLDLVESHRFNLKNTIIMETGGMKGRRKELVRNELHEILCKGFGVSSIHSEYGMTELLSQGYSNGKGIFTTPPWMKVYTRDTEDALSLLEGTKTGGLNVIDLANRFSCPFIATQDLGRVYKDGSFTVIGRFDNSDIRGCNLMSL
ncbi:acyl transferase [Dokdonia sp. Dokd-P16]|uniref:acyl transferase n=1 Tax=Dokdonia sp. Dokd-P16 TaxID=2173169 RepID=UPI000D547A04|nr:acyl transferase [Dokdonia sp. Dokd-P16]AWH75643.1 acyl transferase [Dokdonia sp. Dokd-P16]